MTSQTVLSLAHALSVTFSDFTGSSQLGSCSVEAVLKEAVSISSGFQTHIV